MLEERTLLQASDIVARSYRLIAVHRIDDCTGGAELCQWYQLTFLLRDGLDVDEVLVRLYHRVIYVRIFEANDGAVRY